MVGATTVEGGGPGLGVGVGEEVAVVALALGGAAEDGVGFGDLDEAGGGGGRVVRVVVWVVAFGEVEVLSVFVKGRGGEGVSGLGGWVVGRMMGGGEAGRTS